MRYVTVVVLGVLAVLWRVQNHRYGILPNLEFLTVAAMLAALMLPRRAAWAVPLAIVVASDLLIGNSNIFLFTWSAWLVTGFLALVLPRFRRAPAHTVLAGTALAVLTSGWFFVWTNFGVWLTSTMYPQTWEGLVACYTAALPFYRTMLIGNLVIVPIGLSVYLWAEHRMAAVEPETTLVEGPAC